MSSGEIIAPESGDITETVFFNETDGTSCYYIQGTDGGGGAVLTGDTTNGSGVITNAVIGCFPGQGITGTGISANTYITSIDASANTVTLSANATATNTGVVFTGSHICLLSALSAN